jgi:diamine N-acetyltransferase
MNKPEISLRPIEFQDAQLVLDWENNVEGWNMEEKEQPYSIFDILSMILEMEDVPACKQIRYMIYLNATQEVIGAADLTDIDFEAHTAGVGILIADTRFRQKGYASQALLQLEEKARSWGLKKLKSSVLEDNAISLHLFEKMAYEKLADSEEGYVVEGVYIKAIVFEKWLNA